MKKIVFLSMLVVGAAMVVPAQEISQVGVNQNARYATDAYPGFDNEKDVVSPTKKEPKWFAFINGPKCENASEQMAYCQSLEEEGDWSKAAKHYDALVREWPTAPEAWKAQLRLAQIQFEQLDEHEDAFESYRYLVDFFSLSCDYNATVDEMYRIAGVLREEGKTIVFFRFKNSTDVRRAFETCVLRAPGAKWAPEALLTIAELREEERYLEEAVKVYENLRNLYPESPEAKTSYVNEANDRLSILHQWGYNRSRCQDTISFLKLALDNCREEDKAEIGDLLVEAEAYVEEEAYRSTRFYDTTTRTKRSALNAYEQYLKEYPEGAHADDVRARLEELKEPKEGESK